MISNDFTSGMELPKLNVERQWLYQPTAEWTYSHHASVTFYKGKFYAIWSNGRINEDDTGQRVLMATAEDFSNWSEPSPLVDSLPGKHSELVLTAAGFHEHEGTLVAYYGQYEYKETALVDGARRTDGGDRGHQDTCLKALTTTDGQTWSEHLDMGVPIVPNHGPQATASGRLIISGNFSHPYTDDPAGLSGWTRTTIWPAAACEGIADDSEGFWIVRERVGDVPGLCEGSWYQTDDGVIHMLQRSGTEKLWLTESTDDGVTWSFPVKSDFSDNVTKFHFGRLPDGRFYYVGCPDSDRSFSRSRLVLSLSEDGQTFGDHHLIAADFYEMQQEGLHKGGQFGYPHTMLHDGCLYVIVSRRKEAVEVIRFCLDQL